MDAITIHIPQELFETSEGRHFEGVAPFEELRSGADTYAFAGPLSWSVDVTNTGEALLVMGAVCAQATTQCARCLEDVQFDLTGDIEGYFLINEDATSVPDDLEGDEFETLPESHDIDLSVLVQAALLLELPVVPLCSEDCKGLCARCGANLNEGSCECVHKDEAVGSNPFAVLADINFEETR